MCAQCMRLFGYVCSPLCKARAEQQGIEVPAYAGQMSAVDARYWRKMGTIGGVAAVLIVEALGFWFWYAWIASIPHVVYSVPFENAAYVGESKPCGTDQIVLLHGGTLARYDIKLGKKVWS